MSAAKRWRSRVYSGTDEIDVGAAARMLAQGRVIAFPTETVYGLGADARNSEAVSHIFLAKGRPTDNPLIVHVASLDSLYQMKLTNVLSNAARSLAKALWPGPLTLVLPLSSTAGLAPSVTAGLNTVGIRVPQHPVAAALLARANVPIAAPSANRSGRPSPTTAIHVLNDLDGNIDGVVDGGDVNQHQHAVGIESTVVDATRPEILTILRPGAVSRATLQRISGVRVEEATHYTERPRAPGMKYRHYAPRATMRLVERVDVVTTVAKTLEIPGVSIVGVWADDEMCACYASNTRVLAISSGPRHDEVAAARGLYSALRQFDGDGDRDGHMNENEKAVDVIIASIPENVQDGIGQALLNRLNKAASGGGVGKNGSGSVQQCHREKQLTNER